MPAPRIQKIPSLLFEVHRLIVKRMISQEIHSYKHLDLSIQYWRSTSLFEVDFVLGQKLALEVKGTDLVSDKHLKGLRAFKEEGLVERYGVVSLDSHERITDDGIHIWPWQVFLTKLWAGEWLLN